eukprot:scaffold31279_cov63-Phaeocystis_antarctica.AAC.2
MESDVSLSMSAQLEGWRSSHERHPDPPTDWCACFCRQERALRAPHAAVERALRARSWPRAASATPATSFLSRPNFSRRGQSCGH